MSIGNGTEIERLQADAGTFADLGVDGFVIGFIENGALDMATMEQILAAAPHSCATFHRAFDHVREPLDAIERLKQLPQFDRVLTTGGDGSWIERKMRLFEWQRAAAPQIRLVVAPGLHASVLAEVPDELRAVELHVGRAARIPQTTSGVVSRTQVASLKGLLG